MVEAGWYGQICRVQSRLALKERKTTIVTFDPLWHKSWIILRISSTGDLDNGFVEFRPPILFIEELVERFYQEMAVVVITSLKMEIEEMERLHRQPKISYQFIPVKEFNSANSESPIQNKVLFYFGGRYEIIRRLCFTPMFGSLE